MKNSLFLFILFITISIRFPIHISAQVNSSADIVKIDGMTAAQYKAAIARTKIVTWTSLGVALGGGALAVLAARDLNSIPETGLKNMLDRGAGSVAVVLLGTIATAGLIAIFVSDNNRLKYSGKLSKFGSRVSMSPILMNNLNKYSLGFSLDLRL